MPRPEGNPLNDALIGVHQRITAAVVNERQARIERDNAQQRMQEIQGMIRTGETTRDPIRDLVIVRYGLEYSKYEERYRQLQVDVENHVGEFALIVGRYESRGNHTPLHLPAHIETTIAFGHLETGEFFIDPKKTTRSMLGISEFTEGLAELSTSKFSFKRYDSRPVLIEQNLPVSLKHLDEELDVEDRLLNIDGSRPKMLEVFIGNEQVAKGFHNLYGLNREKMTEIPTLMLQMAESIGRPINGQLGFNL